MDSTEIRFDGQAVLVTGAGRGLGRAQALLLASRGAQVVVADNGTTMEGEDASAGPAETVVTEIRDAGGHAVACTADLSTRAGCDEAVAACVDAFGRIDGIAHYASSCPDLKSPENLAERDMELVLAINPLAAMRLVRAVWPHMVSQGHGRIVLVPSGAVYGALGNTPYAAAKAAHIGIVRCLALEGEEHGIRANGVMPAARSRMTEGFLPPGYAEWFFENMPPEKVAVGAGFLLSGACDLNGEIFAMGGGRIARVTLSETDGVIGAGDSIEAARDAMPKVMAQASWHYPNDLSERSAIAGKLFDYSGTLDIPGEST